jgi:aspartate/methionine/tyrosine aminotransferase
VVKAFHEGVEEMGSAATFKGYGPEQGYEFLREAIAKNDYQPEGSTSALTIFLFPMVRNATPATFRRFSGTIIKLPSATRCIRSMPIPL